MCAIIDCPICRKERKTQFGLCVGCGHPADKVPPKDKPEPLRPLRRADPDCPACRSRSKLQLEPGRWICNSCDAVFEASDFGFVDDRPDVNAQKREASTIGRKRGRR